MGSGDGVSVDEGEELLENVEEGPLRQDTDALLDLQAAVGDGSAVDHAEQAEPDALPLRQQLSREGLVELDGCSVHLRGTSHLIIQSYLTALCSISLFQTFP